MRSRRDSGVNDADAGSREARANATEGKGSAREGPSSQGGSAHAGKPPDGARGANRRHQPAGPQEDGATDPPAWREGAERRVAAPA